MKEIPILFNGEMVRAILDGRKTQTRRVVKQRGDCSGSMEQCPYGQPGDRLWVRETWACSHLYDQFPPRLIPLDARFAYAATEHIGGLIKRPSIHMPRWASRITLEIESVRVERVQEITRGDAMEEGCPFSNMQAGPNPKHWFRDLWDSINGPRGFGWDVNPFVWAITFRRVK